MPRKSAEEIGVVECDMVDHQWLMNLCSMARRAEGKCDEYFNAGLPIPTEVTMLLDEFLDMMEAGK